MFDLSEFNMVTKDPKEKNNQNNISSSFGFLITWTNVGIPPMKLTINPIERFKNGSFVKIQRPKLKNKKIVDTNSIGPNIFFDLFKLKINIKKLPKKPKIPYKITEKLFFNNITLINPFRASINQITLL